MNPTDVKTIIDTAATQSDRWLFIALLVIGIFVVWGLFRYFTGQLDKLAAKLDETNNFMRGEHTHLIGKCTDALNVNTRVIERLTDRDSDEVTERTHPHLRPTHQG